MRTGTQFGPYPVDPLDSAQFREKILAPNFIYSIASPPEVFAERIRLETVKWGKIIRDNNIKSET